MTIKKKLGLGVASAALGLSLIGGGTFAAFNDTATINNHFASGTLDLNVAKMKDSMPINFDISNMKPGDSVEREFKLNNSGSLAIKEILLNATAHNFNDPKKKVSKEDFLSQFKISLFLVDQSTDQDSNKDSILKDGVEMTLNDLVNKNFNGKIRDKFKNENGINLAPVGVGRHTPGLISGASNSVVIGIEFINDLEKDSNGKFVQNKFMNNEIDFFFDLEATQWDGGKADKKLKINRDEQNGKINNGNQVESGQVPNPKTDGKGKHDNQVDQ
ncbi:TasA family protein [Rossellomorea marisflavi]|uniref:TasA family protein n=1 Tax=Rossellomorea marisflavi TaxID=189381 RepID=UPI00069EF476|nr:TasA family protein [Rossellomorea marisflavi]